MISQTAPPKPGIQFVSGMRVQSRSVRLPQPLGAVRTHFGVVTRTSSDMQRVYVQCDGRVQEDEMFVHELEMERPCKHPASRQYAWHAYNHLTDKVDALCICCCDCGAVLKGGATLASDEAGATEKESNS